MEKYPNDFKLLLVTEEENNEEELSPKNIEALCPECGSPLSFVGHCGTCFTCGFSFCSI